MPKKVFSDSVLRPNTPAGRGKYRVKSILFLALFIGSVIFVASGVLAYNLGQSQIYSFSWLVKDPNYFMEDISASYNIDRLVIETTISTNYSGHTPSNSFIGLSAGVNLAGSARVYTWNDGWIDQTGSINHLESKVVGPNTYDHIYYYPFNTLPDVWEKRIKVEIIATKQQIKQWIQSSNNLIFYFGEATSVIKITVGATDYVTGNNYYVGMEEQSGYMPSTIQSITNQFNYLKAYSLYQDGANQIGSGVTDCSFTRPEITDLKVILTGISCGGSNYAREWIFVPNYFYANDSSAMSNWNTDHEFDNLGIFEWAYKAANGDLTQTRNTDVNDINFPQQWAAGWHTGGSTDEVFCMVVKNDSLAVNTDLIFLARADHATADTMRIGYGTSGGAQQATSTELNVIYKIYSNASSDYWDECHQFWYSLENDLSFTDTKGTSRKILKGAEYEVTADANNEIDVIISQDNSNQTHVLLTLNFNTNLTFVNITNSTNPIILSTPVLNNFLINEAGGNFSYDESATPDTEPANISTCVVSNITGNTRCYAYLPFGSNSNIYLTAELASEIAPSVDAEFITPTLSNASYTGNDYIEVNVSVTENVTSCSLEWDDGSPANISMTVENADANTYCWKNQTGLTDREYLFTGYAEIVTGGLNDTGERNITLDLITPTLYVVSPLGDFTNTDIQLSYSIVETNLDSCWYSIDGGANTSLPGCLNRTIAVETNGTHIINFFANDSLNNQGTNSSTFNLFLFNLAVYNATDNATITDWDTYITNATASYTSLGNTNTLIANLSEIPGGNTEMIIFQTGYGNASFNFTNTWTYNTNFVRHIISDNGLTRIDSPDNNTVFSTSQEFVLNVTMPNYAEGNGTLWYSVNGAVPYIKMCEKCRSRTATITLGAGDNNLTVLINNTVHYKKSDNHTLVYDFDVFAGKYNISFFDELTNKSLNFPDNKNGTLRIICANTDTPISISGPLYDYTINCTGGLDYLEFTLFDQRGTHYRTLIPETQSGNITFYMINTTKTATTIVKTTFNIVDTSLIYREGKISFRKVILGEGIKDIINRKLGAADTIEGHLIIGETYTIHAESADGLNSKTVGQFTAKAGETSRTLVITELAFIPAHTYIGTDIFWSMQFNTSTGRIYFYWNDSTNTTTLIKFWIYNATNIDTKTQVYYDSVSDKSNHLFQWAYTSENDTYIGYFEVTTGQFGNLTGSRTLSRYQIYKGWLGDISINWYIYVAVALLVFTAGIFGALHAKGGAIVLAIEAGLFFYIGWLPVTSGFTYIIIIFLIAFAILSKFASSAGNKAGV